MGRFRRWIDEIFGSDSDDLPERMLQWCNKKLERDPQYICGEICGNLQPRAAGSSLDKEADHKLLRRERAYIKYWTRGKVVSSPNGPPPAPGSPPGPLGCIKDKKSSDKNLTGIALSGGGIRSATFSLGVLQALASSNVLQYIDYISSVSGGGYIGSGLTWWLAGKSGSKETYSVDSATFPYGIDDPARPSDNQTPILTHLRDNASYLAPGGGLSYLSGIAILIRAVFLNLLVWVPISAALWASLVILGSQLADSWSIRIPNPIPQQLVSLLPNCKELLIDSVSLLPNCNELLIDYQLFYLSIWLGLSALVWFALACMDFAFFTRLDRDSLDESEKGRQNPSSENRLSDAFIYGTVTPGALSVAIFVAVVWVGYLCVKALLNSLGDPPVPPSQGLFVVTYSVVVAAAAVGLGASWIVRWLWRKANLGFLYSSRRLFEALHARVLLLAFILLALGSIPFLVAVINNNATINKFGAMGVILGSAIGVWGHLAALRKKLGRWGSTVVLPIGSVLLFFGIAIISFQLSIWWLDAKGWQWAVITAIILIGASLIFLTNINQISPRAYYRDRLMEAFLPDIERVEIGSTGSAKRADRFRLSEAWDCKKPKGPYPIINTNVVLVNSPTLKYRLRGGDNFALTPLYCGSNATGWGCTKKFAQGKLTLATAMAISGAAANPNTGVGGKGLTRNRFISMVMTLLNLRLGFWVRRPRRYWLDNRLPDHLHPGLTFCIPTIGYKEGRNFLELSDGGHFENLGLYELVRRGCRLIIVCDGGQDIRASYSDFVAAICRIGQDFGAEIEFEPKGGPERMIARPRNDEYPKDAEYATHGFLWATIKYRRWETRGGPKEGRIVYVKTTMIPALGVKAKGYKGAEPSFPDQTTIDQFFDEEQFEAYREVGYRIAETMLQDEKLKLKQNLQLIKNSTEEEAWLPSVSTFWPA